MSRKELNQIQKNIETVILGKSEVIKRILAALVAGGHVLVEDVPGVGKTYLARSLALSIKGDFSRIQFTPDLLPTDVTGVSIYNQKKKVFEFRKGPVFTNILLADEINRATPRTQSALLESMQEKQVSAEGKTHELPELFFVIATQNPIEQQGVYHLPEAQLDRFLIQISIGYPKHFIEMNILNAQSRKHPIEDLEPVADVEDILRIREEVKDVHVDEAISDYIVALVERSRSHPSVDLGGSPRASLALYMISRAMAYMEGEDYVRPDIIKEMAKPVLRHRLILKPQARLGGTTPDQVIEDIVKETPVPVTRPGKEF